VDGSILATAFAPISTAPNAGSSFVGVHFNDGEQLARVAIISGVVPLGPGNNEGPSGGDVFDDAIAMDDFIYGEPIAIGAPCPGDVDGSRVVDLYDLSWLLSSYGLCIPIEGFNPAADLSGNGCVDLSDLTTLLAHFGSTCE
jgi:hypothetical protein